MRRLSLGSTMTGVNASQLNRSKCVVIQIIRLIKRNDKHADMDISKASPCNPMVLVRSFAPVQLVITMGHQELVELVMECCASEQTGTVCVRAHPSPQVERKKIEFLQFFEKILTYPFEIIKFYLTGNIYHSSWMILPNRCQLSMASCALLTSSEL